MEYRWATAEDIEQLVELRVHLLRDMGVQLSDADTHDIQQATRAYLKQHLPHGRHFTVVCAQGVEVVGTGTLEVFERLPYPGNLRGREGYILNIYVQPEARRQGIAGEIVRRLVERGAQEDLGRLWLHATAAGKGVYEAVGFEARIREEMQLRLE